MEIRSLAVEPASIQTTNWRSSRYKHWINGFIVDGDYLLVKANRRTLIKTKEYVWNDIIPPFDVPVGEGIPTLVNPDNPFYIWDKKPEQWHPCWFMWVGPDLTIVDMVTGETIGRGLPCQADALVFSCSADGEGDCWADMRKIAADFYKVFDIVELSLPSKARILSEMSSCQFWHSESHGRSTVLGISSEETLKASEVGWALKSRVPYVFAFISGCEVMSETGLGTFSHVFTKNLQGCTVIGLKNVKNHIELWKYVLPWKQAFYEYLRQEGFIGSVYLGRAFENAVVDYPMIAPIVGIFSGSSDTPEEYQNLTVEVAPEGAGYTEPSSGLYSGQVSVTAYPNTGWEFQVWSVSGTDITDIVGFTEKTISFTLDEFSQCSLVAMFWKAKVYHTLKITVFPTNGGHTQPSVGSFSYLEDLVVEVTAYPNSGYEFDYWELQDGGKIYQSSIQVTMNQDWEATAYFKTVEELPVTQYTLTFAVDPSNGGYTDPPIGSHIYDKDATVIVTAYPYPGYEFDHWEGEIGLPVYTNPIQLTVFADLTYTAHFKGVVVPPTTYTLTVKVSPAGGGYTTPSVGDHTYDYGTIVPFAAYPYSGYEFDYWEGITEYEQATSPYSSGEVGIQVDTTIIAHFKEVIAPSPTHILTVAVSPLGSGYTVPDIGTHSYDEGYIVTLTAYPYSGYEFDYWEDGEGTKTYENMIGSLEMDSDKSYTAYFKSVIVEPVTGIAPGEQKTAIVPMRNPSRGSFDYSALLYLGEGRIVESLASFNLESGETKDARFPIIMPVVAGEYPVFLDVLSKGEILVHYQSPQNVIISPITITLLNGYVRSPFESKVSEYWSGWTKTDFGLELIPNFLSTLGRVIQVGYVFENTSPFVITCDFIIRHYHWVPPNNYVEEYLTIPSREPKVISPCRTGLPFANGEYLCDKFVPPRGTLEPGERGFVYSSSFVISRRWGYIYVKPTINGQEMGEVLHIHGWGGY